MPILLVVAMCAMLLFPFLFLSGGSFKGFMGGTISPVGQNEIPAQYIPIYRAAEARYGVPWNLLAAIHRVETNFSTLKPMVSYVGAEGHMQFMPCTWVGWSHPTCGGLGQGNMTEYEKESPSLIARYGGYGVDADGDGRASMWSLRDAVFSAAYYLAKNGAVTGNMERAVFTYNRSQQYVSEVMMYAQLYVVEGFIPIEVINPSANGFARPLSGIITSRFGIRVDPVTNEPGAFHQGIDFACVNGKERIPASKGGKVIYAGWQDVRNPKVGYGQYVRIDHGGGFRSTYAHMSRITVQVGDVVDAGDVVGICGSTGKSTGPHLHFEIIVNGRQVDPASFIGLEGVSDF